VFPLTGWHCELCHTTPKANADGTPAKLEKLYSGPINLPDDLLWMPMAKFYEHESLLVGEDEDASLQVEDLHRPSRL
jgi:hypothetical protein